MAVNIKILGLLAASVLCWVLIVTATATADWSETNPSGSCDEKRGLWESCFEGPGCQQVTCQQIEDDDNLDAKERATRTFIILACMIGGVASACLGLMVFVEGSGCALTVVILHVVTGLFRMLVWPEFSPHYPRALRYDRVDNLHRDLARRPHQGMGRFLRHHRDRVGAVHSPLRCARHLYQRQVKPEC